MSKNRFMILDRDGLINYDYGYVGTIERFHFIDRNMQALTKLLYWFHPIIITNQSGIARGFYSEASFYKLTKHITLVLTKKYGWPVTKTYHCPHHPKFKTERAVSNCKCRKPGTLLFETAISEYDINVEESITIGDNFRDVEPGLKLGFMENFLLCKKKPSQSNLTKFVPIETMDEVLKSAKIQALD